MAPGGTLNSPFGYLHDTNFTLEPSSSEMHETLPSPLVHPPRWLKRRRLGQRRLNVDDAEPTILSRSNNSNNSNNGNNANNGSNSKPAQNNPSNPFSCPQCFVRDNDPRVRYEGVWTLNGTSSSTTHSTTLTNSSLSLRFNGSGIVIFGTVPTSNDTAAPPTVVYYLDSDPPFTTTLPLAGADITNQPLFASPSQLSSDDEHFISINITKADTPYTFSSFFIFPVGSSAKDMMIGQVPSNIPVPVPSSQMAPPTTSGRGPMSSAQTTVRVLAGVVGLLVGLIIVAGLAFCFIRRRMLRQMLSKQQPNEKTVTLFREVRVPRPETVYTHFTTTEDIMRNDPNLWSPRQSGTHSRSSRGWFSRTDGYRSEGRTSMVDFVPPPLPPKSHRGNSPKRGF